jgi:MFS family permease
MNTISTYNTYLSTHQLSDHSESSIGWIFSVYSLLTFFCGIQIGPVFDVRGPRLLVLAGSIMLMGICSRVFILNIYITYYYITRKYL